VHLAKNYKTAVTLPSAVTLGGACDGWSLWLGGEMANESMSTQRIITLMTSGQRILTKGRITCRRGGLNGPLHCMPLLTNDSFCCKHHSGDCQCFSVGQPTPKSAPLNTRFHGPTQVRPPNSMSIG